MIVHPAFAGWVKTQQYPSAVSGPFGEVCPGGKCFDQPCGRDFGRRFVFTGFDPGYGTVTLERFFEPEKESKIKNPLEWKIGPFRGKYDPDIDFEGNNLIKVNPGKTTIQGSTVPAEWFPSYRYPWNSADISSCFLESHVHEWSR